MDLQYKAFDRAADLEQQRELFALCFPESLAAKTNTREHYSWKFCSTEQISHEYIVTSNDKMMGYYAAISYPYSMAGEKQNIAMVCDVMTHPDARGKGLFTKLGAYATEQLHKEHFAFSTGFPVRPEVIPGHLKVGWHKTLGLPVYLCPLRADAILSTVKLRWAAPVFNVLLGLVHGILTAFHKLFKNGYEISVSGKESVFSNEAYETFYNHWSKSRTCFLEKTPQFLQWRLGAPNADYDIFYARKNTAIVAVMIARKTVLNDIPCLAILDVMVLPEAKSSLPILISHAKKKCAESGLEAMALTTNRSYFKTLRLFSSGFIRTHVFFTFIVKLMNTRKTIAEMSDDKNWCLTWIDSDDL